MPIVNTKLLVHHMALDLDYICILVLHWKYYNKMLVLFSNIKMTKIYTPMPHNIDFFSIFHSKMASLLQNRARGQTKRSSTYSLNPETKWIFSCLKHSKFDPI